MSDEEFIKLEDEMKMEFHRYNMGLSRLIRKAISRSSIYMNDPKTLFDDFRKFLSWM